ncbi:hypothetical protein GQ54DRAFT_40388 [Martensiomyces pterosporus]|nr:hypothetical protein GQ54DRAFT_40388 [Martensiomyces pterosporus]
MMASTTPISRNGDGTAERLVDASSDVLQSLTDNLGGRAKRMCTDFASTVDGMENSSGSRLAVMMQLLQQTEKTLEGNRELLARRDVAEQLQACRDGEEEAAKELREATDGVRAVLASIEARRGPLEEKRKQHEVELQRQNADFEARLKKEHEEFVKRHARRLADVLEHQQIP